MAIITKIEENKAVIGKKKVAAYCRVSTDQDDQLLSLETQKAHYESWIQGHSDWEYAGLYYDEGLSGTKMDTRPSLLRMMEDCKHGLIDYVVTKSVSRLARNTADFLTIVRTLLDLGIPIYFEKENIDTGSMENELMLSIMSSIAESESVSISENNKWSIQRKFKNGTYKCSYPPYGYDWDKKNGEMVVNPEQAEIVRYIFAQTLAGVGTHDIAKDLMAKGVPTKKGGKWTGHTVNGIIRNEKYTGDCLFQKEILSLSLLRQQSSKGYTESTLKGQVIGIFATALWQTEYLPGQEKRNGFQAPFIRFYQMRSTSVTPFFKRPLPRTFLKRKGKSIMDLLHSTMWKTATKPLFQETFL